MLRSAMTALRSASAEAEHTSKGGPDVAQRSLYLFFPRFAVFFSSLTCGVDLVEAARVPHDDVLHVRVARRVPRRREALIIVRRSAAVVRRSATVVLRSAVTVLRSAAESPDEFHVCVRP